MKNLNLLIFLLCIFTFTSSCKAQYVLKYAAYENGKPVEYFLNLPSTYKLKFGRDYHGYTEKIAVMSDSSRVFITNDNEHGGGETKKWKKNMDI